jgi:hypothetical protein
LGAFWSDKRSNELLLPQTWSAALVGTRMGDHWHLLPNVVAPLFVWTPVLPGFLRYQRDVEFVDN